MQHQAPKTIKRVMVAIHLLEKGKGEKKVGHFDCTDLMGTLNAIDDKNIRTVFKQAKRPGRTGV